MSRTAVIRSAYVVGAVLVVLLVFSLGRHSAAKPASVEALQITATTEAPTTAPPAAIPTTTTLQIHLTDDATLKAALTQASIQLMGKDVPNDHLTVSEVNRFVATYHAEEKQQQMNDANGQDFYSIDPQTHADTFVNTNYPNAVKSYTLFKAMAPTMLHGNGLAGPGGNGGLYGSSTTTTTSYSCGVLTSYCE